jgi:hypothetical protein
MGDERASYVSIHKMTKVDGLHPKEWPIEHVADVGYNEPFVWSILEIATPVDASILGEKQRKDVKHGLATILTDGLVPAFLDLRQIRENDGKKIPTINREEPYGNMARTLWKAFKPLMSDTALTMGFQIGFLYDNDRKFAAGLAEFRKDNPSLRPGFEEFLESGRTTWQQELADFRNKWLEHPVGNRKQSISSIGERMLKNFSSMFGRQSPIFFRCFLK